jgi:hypothetical protein
LNPSKFRSGGYACGTGLAALPGLGKVTAGLRSMWEPLACCGGPVVKALALQRLFDVGDDLAQRVRISAWISAMAASVARHSGAGRPLARMPWP